MDNKKDLDTAVFQLANETFSKLNTLSVPPYPRYYHDTFVDTMKKVGNSEVLEIYKKNAHLFSHSRQEELVHENCFTLVKKGIDEFSKSNDSLKAISDETSIDIDTLKNSESGIDANLAIQTLDGFQSKIMQELKAADETIAKLKFEVERLEKESNVDPLTKTFNRRVLVRDLSEMLSGGAEKDLDLHFVIFDADDFKKINDTFGHIAGDKTLIFIAKQIQGLIRKDLRIYRYGGEEFVVVLNNMTSDEANKTVENILKTIDESKLLYKGYSINLTLSAGICSHKQNMALEELLDKADKALYEAKHSGKNCYRCAN